MYLKIWNFTGTLLYKCWKTSIQELLEILSRSIMKKCFLVVNNKNSCKQLLISYSIFHYKLSLSCFDQTQLYSIFSLCNIIYCVNTIYSHWWKYMLFTCKYPFVLNILSQLHFMLFSSYFFQLTFFIQLPLQTSKPIKSVNLPWN